MSRIRQRHLHWWSWWNLWYFIVCTHLYLKVREAALSPCVSEKTIAVELQSFNETIRHYKGYQAWQCCMEHVGKFDEMTTLSVVIHNLIRRGTLNRKGRLYKERICTGSGRVVRTSFRLVRMQRASVRTADYRYRDSPSVMFSILTDSDYFACASDALDVESEKLKCISGLPVILPI